MSDNGPHFRNDVIAKLSDLFSIKMKRLYVKTQHYCWPPRLQVRPRLSYIILYSAHFGAKSGLPRGTGVPVSAFYVRQICVFHQNKSHNG